MKRTVLAIIILVTLFSISIASAEEVDYSQYSDEAILELLKNVEKEVSTRGLLKQAKLPQGYYYVGIDIDAGKYIVNKIERDKIVRIGIYTPKKDDPKSLVPVVEQWINPSEDKEVVITLNDNDVIDLEYGGVYIRPFEKISFD